MTQVRGERGAHTLTRSQLHTLALTLSLPRAISSLLHSPSRFSHSLFLSFLLPITGLCLMWEVPVSRLTSLASLNTLALFSVLCFTRVTNICGNRTREESTFSIEARTCVCGLVCARARVCVSA